MTRKKVRAPEYLRKKSALPPTHFFKFFRRLTKTKKDGHPNLYFLPPTPLQCPRTNVNWISSLSESDRLEIQLTFGFRCWWLNEAKTRPRARPCYMGVDLCTAHNWGPCGQLPGLKTWGAHQELATHHGGMFGGMDVLVSMTWMNVLMPRCLLSLVILLEISPTYRWKIYLTRKNAHKKLDQNFFWTLAQGRQLVAQALQN